jgi:hypothetical protein
VKRAQRAETKLGADLRKSSYPALNWAARKAAENAEAMLEERLKAEERSHQEVCHLALEGQGYLLAATVWKIRQRIAKQHGEVVAVDVDELLMEMCYDDPKDISFLHAFVDALDARHDVAMSIGWLAHLAETEKFFDVAKVKVQVRRP